MTTPEHDAEVEAPAPTPAPHTGHPRVDAALREFGSLGDHPPAEQRARISAVVEALTSVLDDRADGSASRAQPGRPGPR